MLSVLNLLLFTAGLLPGPATKPPQTAPAGVRPPVAAPIPWSAARKLVIADFQGRPSQLYPQQALTTADIKAGADCRDYVFTGTVQALFDPTQSWFRQPLKVSATLLQHEQTHFDLTEVYARLLRQKLVVFQAKVNCEKLQPGFNNLTKTVYAAWAKEQNRYDAETAHGVNAARQAFWEKEVQLRLTQLDAFAAH